jgi:hypothetical protein
LNTRLCQYRHATRCTPGQCDCEPYLAAVRDNWRVPVPPGIDPFD